jgi:DNA-binding response OmpR family regulator
MKKDFESESGYVLIEDTQSVERLARRRRRFDTVEEIVDPWSYLARRGLGTLRLSMVEFRIFEFLSRRPNQAFTRSRIARAVSTTSHRVTEETLGSYVASLRGQLGFYSDYIQAVPYIGWRFKA